MTSQGESVALVVDIDGTLLRGDLLHEAALQFVARHPFQAWRLAMWLLKGKATLKHELAARIDPGVGTIPVRAETAAAIHDAQKAGRPVWLASASPQRWAEGIAERIGGIAGVIGSDPTTNLAGARKADALVARFGAKNFDYIGDNRVDFPVWSVARRQLVIAHRPGFMSVVRRRFPDAQTIAVERFAPRPYFRALRMHQWAKNLLVLLPVIAGHRFTDPASAIAAAIAFFAFSSAASSAYIVNDLLDLPGDRDHPRKRFRPFASGEIGAIQGISLSAVLMLIALALALALPPSFLLVLGFYVVLTLIYSLILKRRLLIDIIVLGGLYTLRVLGGVTATVAPPSQWLLMFSLFLFLSLAAVKRCSELVARREAGLSSPPGRGYMIEDLAVLFPLAAAAGYAAVLIVTLYLSSPEVTMLYAHPARMWLICPLLLYWISRVLVISNRNQLHDDPVIFALTDRISWGVGALIVLVIAASI